MKKIAIINNKGGVGKSTTAVQISHGLAKLNSKVLLVDLDGQNDSSSFLGFMEEDFDYTLNDMEYFNGNIKDIKKCIINARDGLDLIINSSIDKINARLYRESQLNMVFEEFFTSIREEYDYIIFDCSPNKNKTNDAVLLYVNHIIMPVEVASASVKAVGNMFEYLAALRQDTDKISLVIPNKFDKRTNDSKRNLERLKNIFEDRPEILTKPINTRVKIKEAGSYGKTVFEYDKEASNQYFKVLEKVVEKIV